MTVLQTILKTLLDYGGQIQGTNRLCLLIMADPVGVRRQLKLACRKKLIVSSLSHGGRNHLSVHRLTEKGRTYANSI